MLIKADLYHNTLQSTLVRLVVATATKLRQHLSTDVKHAKSFCFVITLKQRRDDHELVFLFYPRRDVWEYHSTRKKKSFSRNIINSVSGTNYFVPHGTGSVGDGN